jgi:uncharacterized iron-regulated membrane protein
VGLIIGIVISMVSLTGASLVFREELDDVIHPERSHLRQGKTLSLDSIRSISGRRYSDYTLTAIFLPKQEHPLLTRLTKNSQVKKVYFNPVTGQTLDEQDEQTDVLQKVFLLHRTLLAGETGKVIMFFFGLGLIVSTLTGIFVYRRQLVALLTGKLRFGKRGAKKWHTIVGMTAFLVNLLFGVTGAMMQYPAVKKMFSIEKNDRRSITESKSQASLDSMIFAAKIDHPDFHPYVVSFPLDKKTVVLRGKFGEDMLTPPARSSIEFSAADGMILKVTNAFTGNFFDDVSVLANPLHMGYWGGPFIKILYVFFGLTPGVLSVTGIMLFYRRQKTKRSLEDELVLIDGDLKRA